MNKKGKWVRLVLNIILIISLCVTLSIAEGNKSLINSSIENISSFFNDSFLDNFSNNTKNKINFTINDNFENISINTTNSSEDYTNNLTDNLTKIFNDTNNISNDFYNSPFVNETNDIFGNITKNQDVNDSLKKENNSTESDNQSEEKKVFSYYSFEDKLIGLANVDLIWERRANITFHYTKIDSDLVDFPMLITEDLMPAEIFGTENSAKSEGCDLRFTKDKNGDYELPFEIVSFDKGGNTAEIWVKTNLSSTENTTIWIWYNNSDAECYEDSNIYGADNVWNDYHFVSHNAIDDSTHYENDGTEQNGVSGGSATGIFGAATDFDGSNDFIEVSESKSFQSISFWMNADADAGGLLFFNDYNYTGMILVEGMPALENFDTENLYVNTSAFTYSLGTEMAPTYCASDPINDQNGVSGWNAEHCGSLSSQTGGYNGYRIRLTDIGCSDFIRILFYTSLVNDNLYLYSGKVSADVGDQYTFTAWDKVAAESTTIRPSTTGRGESNWNTINTIMQAESTYSQYKFFHHHPSQGDTSYLDDISLKQITSYDKIQNSQWYHVTINSTPTKMNDLEIGRFQWSLGFNNYFNGRIDEIKISNRSRSKAWIDAEYASQANPLSFATPGDPLFNDEPTPPEINFTSPTYSNGETVNERMFEINVTINDERVEEVKYIWENRNYTIFDKNLILMMNFDNVSTLEEEYSSSDSVVKDLSLCDNDGLTKNSVGENLVQGKYGNSFDFDGIDDYILVENSKSLNSTEELTITAWISPKDPDDLPYYKLPNWADIYFIEQANQDIDKNALKVQLTNDGTSYTENGKSCLPIYNNSNVTMGCFNESIIFTKTTSCANLNHFVVVAGRYIILGMSYNFSSPNLQDMGRKGGVRYNTISTATTRLGTYDYGSGDNCGTTRYILDETVDYVHTYGGTSTIDSVFATKLLDNNGYLVQAAHNDYGESVSSSYSHIGFHNEQSYTKYAWLYGYSTDYQSEWQVEYPEGQRYAQQTINQDFTSETMSNPTPRLLVRDEDTYGSGGGANLVIIGNYPTMPNITRLFSDQTGYDLKDENFIVELKTMDPEVKYDIVEKEGSYGLYHNGDGILGIVNNQRILYKTNLNNYFAGLTYNSSHLNLYINGFMVNSTEFSDSITSNKKDLIIGSFFNGTIDELRIWNTSFDKEEIYQIYATNLRKNDLSNWTLYINQSQNATHSLDNGEYSYSACATNFYGLENCTETRSIIISSSEAVNRPPQLISSTSDSEGETKGIGDKITIITEINDSSSQNVRILISNNSDFQNCRYTDQSGCLNFTTHTATGQVDQINISYIIKIHDAGTFRWYVKVCDSSKACDTTLNPRWVYQEFADKEDDSNNQTLNDEDPPQDGGCELNYSGSYALTENWVSENNLNDGDWSTYGTNNGTDSTERAYIYINYSKPRFAQNPSLWQIYHGGSIMGSSPKNKTISIQCWNYDPDFLFLRVMSEYDYSEDGHSSIYSCKNSSSDWVILNNAGGGPPTSYDHIFEEAMWWNVTPIATGTVNVMNFDPVLLNASDNNAELMKLGEKITFSVTFNDSFGQKIMVLIANNSNFTNCNYSEQSGCMNYTLTNSTNSEKTVDLSYTIGSGDSGTIRWYTQVCDIIGVCDNTMPKRWANQEFTNIIDNSSNQTVKDDDPPTDLNYELIYDGNYTCRGNWINPCSTIYDGNWSTNSYSNDASEIISRYYKPYGAKIQSVWQIKEQLEGSPYYRNFTIPLECWEQEIINLKFNTSKPGAMGWGNYYCYDGDEYVKLDDESYCYHCNIRFFEESMIWKKEPFGSDTFQVLNYAPTLINISDNNAEIKSINEKITFTFYINDSNGEGIMVLISNNSNFESCNYSNQNGCMNYSDGVANGNDMQINVTYYVQSTDSGTIDWYGQVCDSSDVCDKILDARLCYQEFADKEDDGNNQTSKDEDPPQDGVCELNYTGSYAYSPFNPDAGSSTEQEWENNEKLVDGNWSTYSYVNSTTYNQDSYFYVNYSKPIGVLNSGYWTVKGGNWSEWYLGGDPSIDTNNLTIPESCWNLDKLNLRVLSTEPATEPTQLFYYCWNTSHWKRIDDFAPGYFYEEAMWWNVTPYAKGDFQIANFAPTLYNVSDNGAGNILSGEKITFTFETKDTSGQEIRILIANNSDFTGCNFNTQIGCMNYTSIIASGNRQQNNLSYIEGSSTSINGEWFGQVCDSSNLCDKTLPGIIYLQEFADKEDDSSNQTLRDEDPPVDGEIQLNYSGNYVFEGDWENPEFVYDGNWSTLGNDAVRYDGPEYIFINYTIPENVQNSSLVKIRAWNNGIQNLNIPKSCWYNEVMELRISTNWVGDNDVIISCWDSTDWYQLYVDMGIYEEAMMWNITSYAQGRYNAVNYQPSLRDVNDNNATIIETGEKITFTFRVNDTLDQEIMVLISDDPEFISCDYSTQTQCMNYTSSIATNNVQEINVTYRMKARDRGTIVWYGQVCDSLNSCDQFLPQIECYQEFADKKDNSNQQSGNDEDPPIDGICRLNYSGSYYFSDQWSNQNNTIDGNWSSYGKTSTWSTEYMYINYSKPDYGLNNSIWSIMDEEMLNNYLIPKSCWDYDSNQLFLRVESYQDEFMTVRNSFSCKNESNNWLYLEEKMVGGPFGFDDVSMIYEEAIIWNMSLPATGNFSSTEAPNIAPSILVLSPLNQTYNQSKIWFNFTANETVSHWIINYNGTNRTIINNSLISVEDGTHHLIVYANDTLGMWESNSSIIFSKDSTDPIIDLNLINRKVNLSRTFIVINWSVSDSNLDSVLINISKVDGSPLFISSNQNGEINLSFNENLTSNGQYNITIFASDTFGNIVRTSDFFTMNIGYSNCNVTFNQISYESGSNIENILGIINITANDNGRCELNITPSQILNLSEENPIIPKGTSRAYLVNLTAPNITGAYKYSLNFSNGQRFAPLFNVTHQVNIMSITPNTDLENGFNVSIEINYSHINEQRGNVVWQAWIRNESCIIYESDNDTVNITLPLTYQQARQSIRVRGTFNNGYAEDTETVLFIDMFPPRIKRVQRLVNLGHESTYNITYFDDTGLSLNSNVTMLINDVWTNMDYTVDGYNIVVNVSGLDKGVYQTRIQLSDSNNYTGLEYSYSIELFRYKNFTDSIRNNRGNSQPSTIRFYRGNNLEVEVNSTNGIYNIVGLFQKRYNVTIIINNSIINFQNLDLSNITRFGDFEDITPFATPPNANLNVVKGLGGQTNISGTHGTIILTTGNLLRTDRIYYCSDWNYSGRNCGSSGWHFYNNISRNLPEKTVEISIDGFSAYIITREQQDNSEDEADSSGGGGGGGGAPPEVEESINETVVKEVNPDDYGSIGLDYKGISFNNKKIEVDLFPGEKGEKVFSIVNNDNFEKEIVLSIDGDASKFARLYNENSRISSGEEKSFGLFLDVPINTSPGTYYGEIIVYSQNQKYSITLKIVIPERIKNPAEIQLSLIDESIIQGEEFHYSISLIDKERISQFYGIKVELINFRLNKTILMIEKEIKEIDGDYNEIFEFKMPNELEPGNYLISAKVSYMYKGKIIEDIDTKEIGVKKRFSSNFNYMLKKGSGVIVSYWPLFVLLFSIYFSYFFFQIFRDVKNNHNWDVIFPMFFLKLRMFKMRKKFDRTFITDQKSWEKLEVVDEDEEESM